MESKTFDIISKFITGGTGDWEFIEDFVQEVYDTHPHKNIFDYCDFDSFDKINDVNQIIYEIFSAKIAILEEETGVDIRNEAEIYCNYLDSHIWWKGESIYAETTADDIFQILESEKKEEEEEK